MEVSIPGDREAVLGPVASRRVPPGPYSPTAPPQPLAVGTSCVTAGAASITHCLPHFHGFNPSTQPIQPFPTPGLQVCGSPVGGDALCSPEGGAPRSRGPPLRIPHHPKQRERSPAALARPRCSPEQAEQHPRLPERGSRGSPPPVPRPGRGHIAPASRPSPGTCVSNVAGSSRESACSESSTKFLSDRVMGPSSLRGAGQGEGMLGPFRTGLEQGKSQTKQRDPGRA